MSLLQLVKGIHGTYNIAKPLAFALAFTGIALCGDITKLTVNLNDLSKHDLIEHNFSLVHRDAATDRKGVLTPTQPDAGLFKLLLNTTRLRIIVVV